MKYLILIHRNPRSRELWEGFSEEQQAQWYAAYAALDEELRGRGVEFSETPEERPYGVDAGFRDPSGNSIRLTEVRIPAEV